MAHKFYALDVLIYSTALEHDAELVTGTVDAHFKGLPQVNYTPKQTMPKATGQKNNSCCPGLG